MARRYPVVIQILRVHRLKMRAAAHFPDSASLQAKWVEARLRMRQLGYRKPRVQIASGKNHIAARRLPSTYRGIA